MLKTLNLIDAFICSSVECNYSRSVENGNLDELYRLIESDGGKISEYNQLCPKCRKSSLEYANYPA